MLRALGVLLCLVVYTRRQVFVDIGPTSGGVLPTVQIGFHPVRYPLCRQSE